MGSNLLHPQDGAVQPPTSLRLYSVCQAGLAVSQCCVDTEQPNKSKHTCKDKARLWTAGSFWLHRVSPHSEHFNYTALYVVDAFCRRRLCNGGLLYEMNCGGNFGPQLHGSFPTPAAEKQKTSINDVRDCDSFQNDHPRGPSIPHTLSDVQPRGGRIIIPSALWCSTAQMLSSYAHTANLL